LDLGQNEWEISHKLEDADHFHLYMSGKTKDDEETLSDQNPGKENTGSSHKNPKDKNNRKLSEIFDI